MHFKNLYSNYNICKRQKNKHKIVINRKMIYLFINKKTKKIFMIINLQIENYINLLYLI